MFVFALTVRKSNQGYGNDLQMRKKRIVALSGGIGNQMFQYAFAKLLERESGCEIEFDTGFYSKTPDRTIGLTSYDIGNYVFKNHIKYNMIRHLFQRIPFLSWIAGTYKEYKQFEIDLRVYKYAYSFYFGYWQNLRYYSDMDSILRERLRYKGDLSDRVQVLNREINGSFSVAVHVRRGDYLEDKSIYHVLNKDYYIKAIDRACLELNVTSTDDLKLYFFSDDIEWCKKNFGGIKTAFFVDNSVSESEHIDILLMRCARCLIMANSTFSWWSAWLSERSDKVVITPDRWFSDRKMNEKALEALIPNYWIMEKCNI